MKRAEQMCRRRLSQQTRRVDHPDAALPRSALCDVPARSDKAVHSRGLPGRRTGTRPVRGQWHTGKVALELGRRALLIELNPDYLKLSDERCCTTLWLPLAV